MLKEEDWFKNQTENILNGIDNRSEEAKERIEEWNEIKRVYQRDVKEPYIKTLKPFDIKEEETEEEAKVKDFAYSNINPYFSERIVKRIDRELKQIETNKRIAKENEKTKIFWLFKYLFGNENKNTVKKYKKEERERIKRVRKFKEREAKLTKDKTPIKHYDYTVSTDKLREDRNLGANHNTSKRMLKQIEVLNLQVKARKKAQAILRGIKKQQKKGVVSNNYLRSLTIFINDIVTDIEPYEVIGILHDLQIESSESHNIENTDLEESETEKLKRYMCYSNKLENLRSYGISYKNLIRADKEKVNELRKEKDLGGVI